ncbi:MAG: hypothetical protein IJV45_06465 [Prevotella sp.]|nr:hypothetical protein [Prevotella sp.]
MKATTIIVLALTATLGAKAQTPSREVMRSTVVEEFTGNRCGYCTRGHAGMARLRSEYGDRFIGIAIHRYNESDPMYFKTYAKLNFQGAPQAMVDRQGPVDPYMGNSTDQLTFGMGSVFKYANAEPATVDVDLKAAYTDDTHTAVEATATIEPLISGERFTIAFALTADSLYDSSWTQYNTYASHSPVGDPFLDQFCTDGVYGQSYANIVFNDVLIASSYNGVGMNTARFPNSTQFNDGEPVSLTHKLSMPAASTPVRAAIKDDLVSVVAIVFSADGNVANARRVAVSTGTSAIADASAAPLGDGRSYDLQGRQVSTSGRGLTIVKRDGQVRKYLK